MIVLPGTRRVNRLVCEIAVLEAAARHPLPEEEPGPAGSVPGASPMPWPGEPNPRSVPRYGIELTLGHANPILLQRSPFPGAAS